MATLADFPLDSLRAGMKFKHPEHGEQIILDLGFTRLGPAIRFHNSGVYDGQMPSVTGDEEVDIFDLIARKTYPYGAAVWEYRGMVDEDEIRVHGWQWLRVACPHCGFDHRLLAVAPGAGQRQCRGCGMVFDRPAQPIGTA